MCYLCSVLRQVARAAVRDNKDSAKEQARLIRERERESKRARERECVCVCVRERERERERENVREWSCLLAARIPTAPSQL